MLYTTMCLTAVIILLILCPQDIVLSSDNRGPGRAYKILVIWVIFYCIVNSVFGNSEKMLSFGSQFFLPASAFILLASSVTMFLWVNFVIVFLGSDFKHGQAHRIVSLVPVLIQSVIFVISIVSPDTLMFRNALADNIRSLLHFACICQFSIYLATAAASLMSMLRSGSKLSNKYFSTFMFVACSAVCGVLQMFVDDVPFMMLGYLLGLCFIHRSVVNRSQYYLRSVQDHQLMQLVDEHTLALNREKELADSANKAKTDFLFSMSHDIRTPMNAIIGFTELMERHIDEPERAKEYLQKIKTSSKYLLELINNVLEMARIEKGQNALDEHLCDAAAFIDSLAVIFEEQARLREQNFIRSTNINHPYVYCDLTKLREVFLNVLSNAFKYTQNGGTVTMSVTEEPSVMPGYCVFRTVISDNGIGMSPDFLPRLFDEFSREQNTTQSKITGTGLGMPITKKLVEFMGGSIEVESELHKGTTFTVCIPHMIGTEEEYLSAAKACSSYDVKALEGKRILLAEDNELNAEIAVELLQDAGINVDRAPDGSSCVDILSDSPAGYYELVLMDVQMPVMDGYEAARLIRSLPDKAKASIPIIAMTANAFSEDKQNALDAGMNGHIPKPFDTSTLMSALAEAVNTGD